MLTLILVTALGTGNPASFRANHSLSNEPMPIVKTAKKIKDPCCPLKCCPEPANGNLSIKNS